MNKDFARGLLVFVILALECWGLFLNLIDRQQCGCSYLNDLTNELKKTNEKSLQEINSLGKAVVLFLLSGR